MLEHVRRPMINLLPREKVVSVDISFTACTSPLAYMT